MTIVVVALGGNAIKKSSEKGTTSEQLANCRITAKGLANLVARMGVHDRLLVTHGNGPQAGNLLLQQEAGKNMVPAHPMDVVGAMTQGQIGYMLQQSMINALSEMRIVKPVCAVVNQVLVDVNDPEFSGEAASKPVGEFYTERQMLTLKKDHPNYLFKNVRPQEAKGWRRVVPSPDPKRNIESEAIRRMVEAGIITIVSGGGGIPVVRSEHGDLRGIEAVIDKDLAGERIAEVVKADVFLVLTDVEHIMLNFGKPEERALSKMSLFEAKRYLDEGQFPPGSMGPKVEACIRFLESGGKVAIVSSLDKALEALDGKTGTRITPTGE